MDNPFIRLPIDASWDTIAYCAYKALKASGYHFITPIPIPSTSKAELLSLVEMARALGLHAVMRMTKESAVVQMGNLVESKYWAEQRQQEIDDYCP